MKYQNKDNGDREAGLRGLRKRLRRRRGGVEASEPYRRSEEVKYTVALAGNPNSGKTTIFNNLTGARQKVGNWPGVTVESKTGTGEINGERASFVDLPGIYGLSTVSIDERIAGEYLLKKRPDVVVDVVDASNLKRNLYLTVQLLEIGCPLVIALNMADEVEAKGDRIDAEQLSRLLRCPVILTVGNRAKGSEELKKAIGERATMPVERLEIRYGRFVDEAIGRLAPDIVRHLTFPDSITAKWIAIKLLEGDHSIFEQYNITGDRETILDLSESEARFLETATGEKSDLLIVQRRYGIVEGLIRECVQFALKDRVEMTERIDNILLNRFFGFPMLLAVMWLLFQFTFTAGEPFAKGIEYFIGVLGNGLGPILRVGPVWLQGFVVQGLLGGIGSLLAFLPNIMLLFLGIAFLEDTGYMARIAFVMDRFMHKIGLHGKSFIPILIGFGCNVPAIMAARTLENKSDRILTIVVNPFISCGARMPIWILMAGAFFPHNYAGTVVFSIVMLGVAVAIFSSLIIKSMFFKKGSAPFVMELPPYRLPTLKGMFIRTWDRSWIFLKKVGTVILAGVVMIWILGYFPWGVEPNSQQSYAGKIGQTLAPVMKPIGLEWKPTVALLFGFVAKEIVVSSLGVLYGPENEGTLVEQTEDNTDADFSADLQGRLRRNWSTLQALSFIIFSLFYLPCLATLATIFREMKSWKWSLFTVGYGLLTAYLLALVVYQGGVLLGYGA